MEFKNGYNLIYEKRTADGRSLFASKDGKPGADDDKIDLGLSKEEIADTKLFYETPTTLKASTSGIPSELDEAFALTVNGESVIGPAGEEPLRLIVTGVDGSVELFGKYVSELQENIVVANDAISGTSNYVTGYTEFSSKPTEQQGNYLALHAEVNKPGATIVFNGKKDVTLDVDGDIVIILKPTTTSVKFTASLDGESVSETYSTTDVVKVPEE